MLEGFKDRADGMPYALYILQTPSPRHTDQVLNQAGGSLVRERLARKASAAELFLLGIACVGADCACADERGRAMT